MHMLSPLQTFTIEGLYSLFRGDREVNWKDEDSIQDQFLSSVDGQAMSKQTRRDFLFLATGVASAVGVSGLVWPFIDQLRPDDDERAVESTITVDISSIEKGMTFTVKWRGKPVMIRNQTTEEIEESRATPLKALKDHYARNANLPADTPATSLARSAGKGRENWIILINICTHLGCIPHVCAGSYNGWFCSCHGSSYDTVGRIRSGPASRNMAIPPYQFISEKVISIR